MNNNKIAILVITCDKFSDFWDPCTEIFNKLIAGFSTSAPYLLLKEAPSVPYILSRKS